MQAEQNANTATLSAEKVLAALFEANDEMGEKLFELSSTQLFRDEKFAEEKAQVQAYQKYQLWQEAALELVSPEPEEKMDRLKKFVLATVFNNLGLTQLDQEEADIFNKLCEIYLLGLSPKETIHTPYLPFKLENPDNGKLEDLRSIPKSMALDKRIMLLAGHLSAMLTTLKHLATFFNEGFVRLLTRKAAEDLLMKVNASQVYFLKISVREPGSLAVAFTEDGKNIEFCFLSDGFAVLGDQTIYKASQPAKTYVIEDHLFEFASYDQYEIIRFFNKLHEWRILAGNRLLEKYEPNELEALERKRKHGYNDAYKRIMNIFIPEEQAKKSARYSDWHSDEEAGQALNNLDTVGTQQGMTSTTFANNLPLSQEIQGGQNYPDFREADEFEL